MLARTSVVHKLGIPNQNLGTSYLASPTIRLELALRVAKLIKPNSPRFDFCVKRERMKSSCVFLLALFSVAHAAGPVPFANVTRLTMMAVNVDIAPDQSFG